MVNAITLAYLPLIALTDRMFFTQQVLDYTRVRLVLRFPSFTSFQESNHGPGLNTSVSRRQGTTGIGICTQYRYRSKPKVSVSEVSVNYFAYRC